ncbi:alpha-L-rhamnosidase [Pleomorphovibrio marinus]|uniref:alpha-L-rhamnosidase n=1 Tax=Pleomorphovibrio marinus TaxID=2164132 RepID=UPI000E0C9E60|nr:alpha-L-rhamnosidase [Pleomorphovibrio marinus]
MILSRIHCGAFFLSLLLLTLLLTNLFAKEGPTHLRVAYLENPEGIDEQNPLLGWKLQQAGPEITQEAYRIIASSSPEKLAANEGDLWDTGKRESGQSQQVPYEGELLNSRQEVYWKVKVWTEDGELDWSEPAFWSMGILNYAEWKSTRWIGKDQSFDWEEEGQFSRLAARYLRTEFELDQPIKKAKVHIIGLGLYELFFNGERVGDHVLAPLPTDYHQGVKINVFDVTDRIKEGVNAIGTILGNGRYYTMRQDYKPYKIKTFGYPKMAMQLHIELEDGTKEVIRTDESWKLTAEGPILTNNEYDGEEYDARKEMPGWNDVGFEDSDWLQASYVQEPEGFFEAQMTPPMRVVEELDPVGISLLESGKYVLDMGQNMVGWVQIRVKGNAGDTVQLRFAESLNEDGSIFTENLRDAQVTDKYILKGDELETWEPRFVYHGFRYVEITGYPHEPILTDFKGKVVNDDLPTVGTFESSDTTLNRIFENAFWGIRGNYKGMPVDCPQRNERQPWLGDRTVGAYGESFLFGHAPLYKKWMDDIQQSQTQDGGIPDVAPAFWRYYGDNVTWPGTYLFVADMLHRQFADSSVVTKHYPHMKKWMDYMASNYMKEGLMTRDKYGDWCVPPESKELIHSRDPSRQTDGVLIASAYYYYLLGLMQKFAKVSGNTQDISTYQETASTLKDHFVSAFWNSEESHFSNGTVTANILPLAFGLVKGKDAERVLDHVVYAIEEVNHGHISTGVIGTQWLMRTLTRSGYGDLALKLAMNTTYPSWGYMVKQGATTIWELWNGDTANPGMNSQNHVMLLGDLLVWYFEDLAGIKSDPNLPGFKRILMRPSFPEKLDHVNASFTSPYGQIRSYWKRNEGGELEWEIHIPANTTAKVYLPTTNPQTVKLNGKPLNEARRDFAIEQEEQRIELLVGPGKFELELD